MVLVKGIEPSRYKYQQILSLHCLPVPAHQHIFFPFQYDNHNIQSSNCQGFNKTFFLFFLKFLFRCVPKTVKMVHLLPFDFIVGCKASFGNILGTLTRKLLHHISLQVILSSCNYRLTNCIFILPHKHYFVNSLILKF